MQRVSANFGAEGSTVLSPRTTCLRHVLCTSRTSTAGLMLRKCIKKQLLRSYSYFCNLLPWKNIRRQTIVILMSVLSVRSFCAEKLAIQCAVVGRMLVPQMLRDPHTSPLVVVAIIKL